MVKVVQLHVEYYNAGQDFGEDAEGDENVESEDGLVLHWLLCFGPLSFP